MPSPDVLIGRIAESQYGVFTYTQAISCGFTPAAIKRRSASGRWRRIHRGVYMLLGAPASFERTALAAVLAVGHGAVASHRTSGRLFCVEGLTSSSDQIDVSVPSRRRCGRSGIRVHHVELLRRDVTAIGRIPVTTPTRTLIDLASVLEKDALEDALDDLVRRKVVRPRELETRLEAIERRGRTGTGVLLRLVRKRTTSNVPGSRWENKLRRALERAGLPEPVRQHVVRDEEGRFVARVDLSYPDERLYIEYDGAQHADPRQRAADLKRQNSLSALGWRPLRFIEQDLRSPAAIVTKVVRARRFS